MSTVNVQHAKTHLSELLAQAERGEDVVIARAGQPVARLVAVIEAEPRQFGHMSFVVPDDFDAPLSEDELSEWE